MTTAYSTALTGLDSIPAVLEDAANLGGSLRIAAATIEVGTADIDDNDIILMIEVPSNAKMHSIVLFNDDLDTNSTPTLTANVGVYSGATIFDTNDPPTRYLKDEVINEDCYATAITTLQDQNTEGAELLYEVKDIANIHNEVWQDAGLTSDPHQSLRIALTISNVAATAAAGTITLRAAYVV